MVDKWSAIFSATTGAYICGFDQYSPMSPYVHDMPKVWPGVVDTVPDVFQQYVHDADFCIDLGTEIAAVPEVTVCIWRGVQDSRWNTGEIDFPHHDDEAEASSDDYCGVDGASHLFRLLVRRRPEDFVEWAEDYYDRSVDLDAVKAIFKLQPLTATVIHALNRSLILDDLDNDMKNYV